MEEDDELNFGSTEECKYLPVIEPMMKIMNLPKYKQFLMSWTEFELSRVWEKCGEFAAATEGLDAKEFELRIRREQLESEQRDLDEKKKKLKLEEKEHAKKKKDFEEKFKEKKSKPSNGFAVTDLLQTSPKKQPTGKASASGSKEEGSSSSSAPSEENFSPFNMFCLVTVGNQMKFPGCFDSLVAFRKVRAGYLTDFSKPIESTLYEQRKTMRFFEVSSYRNYVNLVKHWLAMEEDLKTAKKRFAECLRILDKSQKLIIKQRNELARIKETAVAKKSELDGMKNQSVTEIGGYLIMLNEQSVKEKKLKVDESQFIFGYLVIGYLHEEIQAKIEENDNRRVMILDLMDGLTAHLNTAYGLFKFLNDQTGSTVGGSTVKKRKL